MKNLTKILAVAFCIITTGCCDVERKKANAARAAAYAKREIKERTEQCRAVGLDVMFSIDMWGNAYEFKCVPKGTRVTVEE